jgi:hypothetical protein
LRVEFDPHFARTARKGCSMPAEPRLVSVGLHRDF